MDDFEQDRIFTPKKIPPLNLDLASLSGGGMCPAQYEGKTHDGRDVYCRYRGGWLTVTVANKSGIDIFEDGTEILEDHLGPPYHGSLSIGQLCALAGITINGHCPSLDTQSQMLNKEGLSDYKDLSGETAFYDVNIQSTKETALQFVDKLLQISPDVYLIQPILDDNYNTIGAKQCTSSNDLKSSSAWIFFGERPKLNNLFPLIKKTLGITSTFNLEEVYPDAMIYKVHYSGFKYPVRPYSDMPNKRIEEQTGITYLEAGKDKGCLYDSLSIEGSFKISDQNSYAKAKQINHVLNDCFPKQNILCFDFLSHERIPDRDRNIQLDPNIANWVGGGKNRWYSVTNAQDFKTPWYIGYQPESVKNITL